MTEQNKQILLQDIFARLPYGIIIKDEYGDYIKVNIYTANLEHLIDRISSGIIKMILRPMSSMTEEEKEEFDNLYNWSCPNSKFLRTKIIDISELIDWLNARHFDYRGLIEKGLAIEALEGMYK